MAGHGGDAEQADGVPGQTSDADLFTRDAYRDLLLKMAVTAESFAVTEDQLARVLLALADRGGLTRIASEVWPLRRAKVHVRPDSER